MTIARWTFPLVALLATWSPLPLFADFVLLTDGTKHEGTIEEKGSEIEITTTNGVVWIDKADVKRIVKSFEDVSTEADKLVETARQDYREAKEVLKEPKEINARLTKAVAMLEKARAMYFDAREIFDTPEHKRLDLAIRDTVQLIKMCRDGKMREQDPLPTPKPSPDGAKPAPPPLVEKPAPTPAKQPEPTPPIDETDDLRKLIEQKSLDEARKKFAEARKNGVAVESFKESLAALSFDVGRKNLDAKGKFEKGIDYIREAVKLDPARTEYKDQLSDALYAQVRSGSVGKGNKAIRILTEVIGMADALYRAQPKETRFLHLKAKAYHWRGILGATKFKWKDSHSQPRRDLTTASDLYREVLGKGAAGEIADEATRAIPNIEENLRLLSGGKRR